MSTHSLSAKEARRLALQQQGLWQKTSWGKSPKGSLQVIERLGYVQIDTISVVERAHHHTLFSRQPAYNPSHLQALMAGKKIFEYWSHAAAYLPMRDYRYSLARKMAIRRGEKHWYDKDPALMQRVLDRIAAEGPLQSRDFQPPPGSKQGPWWDWKPAKIALEQLFMEGYLMVVERRGFQKVYDLTERVLPSDTDTTEPSANEMARHLVLSGIGAHGLLTLRQMGYLRRSEVKKALPKVIRQLEEEKKVLPVQPAGCTETYYTTPALLEQLPLRTGRRRLHLLSPFDNLVIQRDRLKQLFDFDYQIECYVPQAKRRYGYFCLPILWGDRFAGRLDPKAERKSKTFQVKQLWLEPHLKQMDAFVHALAASLWQLARFNGCQRIHILQAETPYLKQALEAALKQEAGQ